MPRRRRPLLLLPCLSLLATIAHAEPAPTRGFVRVEGDRFSVDGKPFAFVGANLEALQGELFRARYRDTLAALAADGLTVGRVWAFGEGPVDASDWFRRAMLFRAGPDGFIEDAYVQLDRVLAEADARGVRLIVTLANNWDDYGGLAMYLRWAGLPVGTGPNDPAREAFYSDERVRGFFRAGLERLLGRTNTVTGRRYVDDPTIFSWELMNESSVPTPSGAASRRAWIAEMARFIKSRDANHLVAAGLGGYGSRAERAEWVRVHKLPEIDYCDSHLYPDAADAIAPGANRRSHSATTDERRAATKRLYGFIDDRAQLARFVVGKPLVIGEFGFRTDETNVQAPRSNTRAVTSRGLLGEPRSRWFARLLDRVRLDGAAGALTWIYQPWIGRERDYGIYVDRGDTDDVRGVLRDAARRIVAAVEGAATERNPRLGPEGGDKFLYQPLVRIAGTGVVHRRWKHGESGPMLAIAPERFASAEFERAGIAPSTAGPLSHVWGAGFGRFRYRFARPPTSLVGDRPPRALRIEARLSSEWPGRDGPPDGGSRVILRLDGHDVASHSVRTDDGLGERYEFFVDDRDVLRRIAGPAPHVLEIAVPDSDDAHGVCIYGAPATDGKSDARATPDDEISGRPVTPGATSPMPSAPADAGPIRLFWETRPPQDAGPTGARESRAAE